MRAPLSINRDGLLAQLRAVHRRAWGLVTGWDDEQLVTQYHRDLSPMGWHLGHIALVEAYWIGEVTGGARLPEDLRSFYFPETSPKAARSAGLPPRAELWELCRRFHSETFRHAESLAASGHDLLRDGYLWRFLLQHHWQHIEVMQQIRHQRTLSEDIPIGRLPAVSSRPPRASMRHVPASRARIGTAATGAFDNELKPHEVEVNAFAISSRPVTNAEYLRFMRDGGYETSAFWDAPGWAWQLRHAASAPAHWRISDHGTYHAIGPEGAEALAPDLPVFGLSYHEACAFARYAGCRLPHEIEWECAARRGMLEHTGYAWEWCANTLYAYPGFRPFPYERYSVPWMDGHHFVLRGGSLWTGSPLRRPSFRNFYTPDKRHVFAGLRLARDASLET
ncbi:MAG: SUMF1/EgtB/PvdO family nonheme iron enzyme [Acidiferrobacteraceae bacterium]